MQQAFDSPKFASMNNETRYFDRRGFKFSEQKENYVTQHRRSSSYIPTEQANSYSIASPRKNKVETSEPGASRINQSYCGSDVHVTDSFEKRTSQYKLHRARQLSIPQIELECPSTQLPSFRSPDPQPKTFEFATSDISKYQPKQQIEQRNESESLVPSRVGSTRRSKENDEKAVDSSSYKGPSSWLAEMERQRIELQKIREEERRRQRMRQAEDASILDQDGVLGVGNASHKREESPVRRKNLASHTSTIITRKIGIYDQEESRVLRERLADKNVSQQEAALDCSTQNVEMSYNDHSKDVSTLCESDLQHSSPFRLKDSILRQANNELTFATSKWTQRLNLNKENLKSLGIETNPNNSNGEKKTFHLLFEKKREASRVPQNISSIYDQPLFNSLKQSTEDMGNSNMLSTQTANSPYRIKSSKTSQAVLNQTQGEEKSYQNTVADYSKPDHWKSIPAPTTEKKANQNWSSQIYIEPPVLRAKRNSSIECLEKPREYSSRGSVSFLQDPKVHQQEKDTDNSFLNKSNISISNYRTHGRSSSITNSRLIIGSVNHSPGDRKERTYIGNNLSEENNKERLSPEKRTFMKVNLNMTSPFHNAESKKKSDTAKRTLAYNQTGTLENTAQRRDSIKQRNSNGYQFLIAPEYQETQDIYSEQDLKRKDSKHLERRPSSDLQRQREFLAKSEEEHRIKFKI